MSVAEDTGWAAAPGLEEWRFSDHVFERAEQAGRYRSLRERALDPETPDHRIAVLRYTAALAAKHGFEPRPKKKPDNKAQKHKAKEAETLSKHEQIVRRVSSTAASDDGYRVQLLDLAARRGGIYRESLNRIHEIEASRLGRFEALGRLWLDYRQFVETQRRDAEESADAS